MMIDFDSVVIEREPKVRKARRVYTPASHLHNTGQWSWQELRDYVVTEIETRFGTLTNRNPQHEYGIFSRFVSPPQKGGWGARAREIAEYAFDVMDGRWGGRPVSIYLFTKGQDKEFAEVIVARLDSLR